LQGKIKYAFSSKIWKYNGTGGWFFISLPKDISREIRENSGWQEEGWGRMKAAAEVKGFTWDTAIWFDKKQATYLLPLKAEIRNKAGLQLNDIIAVSVSI